MSLKTVNLDSVETLASESKTWPTEKEAPLPFWARTGNFVFWGWNGGPLEAEKGLRSGWPGFTREDTDGVVHAYRDLLSTKTIAILRTARANWVYITWSNGWTEETEHSLQWDLARHYIEECHRLGIRVSGYVSGANMFWEDFFAKVPESQQWVDRLYPDFVRHYGNSMYRIMADISHPRWREEIKRRCDRAVEAGIDGFWIDNIFWWHGEDRFFDFINDIREHVGSKRRDLIWHINVNRGAYTWGRAGNVIGTEDARLPGYHPAQKGKDLSNNGGLHLFHQGLTEGWRSVVMQQGFNGQQADDYRLMIAESWAYQVGFTWYSGDKLLKAKWYYQDAEAWKILEAIGGYHQFQLDHSAYFAEPSSISRIGIVGHPGSVGKTPALQGEMVRQQHEFIQLLNQLAAANIHFDVLFEDRLTLKALMRYRLVITIDPDHVPGKLGSNLWLYAREGGTVIAPGANEDRRWERGRVILRSHSFLREAGSLSGMIRQLAGPETVEAVTPPHLIYHLVKQTRDGERYLLHLVNYKLKAGEPVTVRVRRPISRVELLSPEREGIQRLALHRDGKDSLLIIPPTKIYDLVAIYSSAG